MSSFQLPFLGSNHLLFDLQCQRNDYMLPHMPTTELPFLLHYICSVPNSAEKPASIESAIRSASQHKVVGRLLNGLKRAGIPSNNPLRKALALQNLTQWATRTRMLELWPALRAGFDRHSVKILVLKGPASSVQLYGDPLVRECTDLDILVDTNDIGLITGIFAELGFSIEPFFKPPVEEWKPKPRAKRPADDTKRPEALPHHTVFWKKVEPFRIECHSPKSQDAAGFTEVVMREFIARSVEATSGPESPYPWSCRTLDLVDQSLFIIAHGTQHGWCTLHWLLDLAAIFEKKDTRFHENLAREIANHGMEKKLKLAASVYRSVFGRTVPAPLAQVVEGEHASLAIELRYVLNALSKGGSQHNNFLNQLRFMFLYSPSFAKSFSEWLSMIAAPLLPSEEDRDLIPLPDELFFLLVPLRPWIVFYKKGRRMFRRRNNALGYDKRKN